LYLSHVRTRMLSPLMCAAAILVSIASPLMAGWQWGVPEGGATLKSLTVPTSPRTAALAGSGLASPASGGEMFGNPVAPSEEQTPTMGFGQVLLADNLGATLSSLHFVQPAGGVNLSAGLKYLKYDDIQGRDDYGMATSTYGAGNYALQFGVSGKPGPFSWGVAGKFASQDIAGYTSRALLCDAGMIFRLNKHLSFGTAMTNLGWVEPYDGVAEPAPLAVQAGISASVPLLGKFKASLHSDYYRRTDADSQLLTGAELDYQEFFILRLGYPFRKGDDGPSAGLGVQSGNLGVDYAYATQPALKGNHHFSVRIAF